MRQLLVSHGRSGRPVTVGRYRLTEARYAPHQELTRHEHAFPSWTLLVGGAFEEVFTRETFVCRGGSVLTKPSAAGHSNRYGPAGAHCLLIELHDAAFFSSELFTAPRMFASGAVLRVAQRIHEEYRSKDPLSGFVLEGLLIELSAASSRVLSPAHRENPRQWLNAVRDHLEHSFRCPPSLAELAAQHRVHPVYLCQAFRAAFGLSVGEFVRTMRFEWARTCLLAAEWSIADVALAAGFSDQAHFSRDFKRRTGTSPRRYRMSETAAR